MMQKIRDHKKISIIVLVVLIIFVILSIAFGRYIYFTADCSVGSEYKTGRPASDAGRDRTG